MTPAATPVRSYDHVLGFALDHPWAVTESMLAVIASIIGHRLAGHPPSEDQIAAALVNRRNLPQPVEGGSVAILPVYGVIAPRANMLTAMSGGTSFASLTTALREALANKAVKTIVLDVDSPGGSVAGATEFAREVMRARTKKPIIAVAQYQMCSAAYWLSAAATEVVAAPSATIGSIGIFTIHDDLSKAFAAEGITRTYLSAGIGKVDGNSSEPLSDRAEARIKAIVDSAYDRFVTDVVKGRGQSMTADRVRGEWKAHAYTATEAHALGLIDTIATLDETLERVMGVAPAAGVAATALPDPTTATDQEPPPAATSQEPWTDHAWQNAVYGALLELDT